jgi:hypothetical protein
MHAPHLMHSYVFTAVCCMALGSFGSFVSVMGFSLPTLSSHGEVKFMITSARIEPPKKFMYV